MLCYNVIHGLWTFLDKNLQISHITTYNLCDKHQYHLLMPMPSKVCISSIVIVILLNSATVLQLDSYKPHGWRFTSYNYFKAELWKATCKI